MVMRQPQQEALKPKKKTLVCFVLLRWGFFPLWTCILKQKQHQRDFKARAKFLQPSSAHSSGFFRWLSWGTWARVWSLPRWVFSFLAEICIYLFYYGFKMIPNPDFFFWRNQMFGGKDGTNPQNLKSVIRFLQLNLKDWALLLPEMKRQQWKRERSESWEGIWSGCDKGVFSKDCYQKPGSWESLASLTSLRDTTETAALICPRHL